jgi:hypothetical protein
MLMKFYKLTNPKYASDTEWRRRNIVEVRSPGRLPGMVCPSCEQWASSDRLRDLDPARAGLDRTVRFLSVEEWRKRAVEWAAALGTPLLCPACRS